MTCCVGLEICNYTVRVGAGRGSLSTSLLIIGLCVCVCARARMHAHMPGKTITELVLEPHTA